MKHIFKKFTFALILIIAFFGMLDVCYGASIGLSVGYQSITVGGSTTLYISGNDAIGRISIYSSDPNVVSVSSSSEWLEGSTAVTLTTKSVGSATITVSAVDMSTGSGAVYTGSNSITIYSNPVYIDTRSSNNNLTSLSVNGYDLKEEFSPDVTDYSVEIPYDVELVEISASVEDSAASYSVAGNGQLAFGENLVTVTVSAENGEEKVYNITVTRKKDPKDINADLKSLVISNANLREKFNKDITTYMCDDLSVEIDKLEITAKPEVEEAKVVIEGNEKLKVGINKITIKVTSKDESVSKQYEIVVYKSQEMLSLKNIEEENLPSVSNKLKSSLLVIILATVVVIELIIIFVLTLKLKNGNSYVYEEESTSKNEIESENKSRRRNS